MNLAITLTHDGKEYRVVVNYDPGRPGVRYLKNGDPGDPPEPPELEVRQMWRGGKEIEPKKVDSLCSDEGLWFAIGEAADEAHRDTVEFMRDEKAERRRDK